MRRRKFIGLLGAAAAWPLSVRAQHAIPVIGFLHSTSPEANEHLTAAFRRGLSELGFVADQNVILRIPLGSRGLYSSVRIGR